MAMNPFYITAKNTEAGHIQINIVDRYTGSKSEFLIFAGKDETARSDKELDKLRETLFYAINEHGYKDSRTDMKVETLVGRADAYKDSLGYSSSCTLLRGAKVRTMNDRIAVENEHFHFNTTPMKFEAMLGMIYIILNTFHWGYCGVLIKE